MLSGITLLALAAAACLPAGASGSPSDAPPPEPDSAMLAALAAEITPPTDADFAVRSGMVAAAPPQTPASLITEPLQTGAFCQKRQSHGVHVVQKYVSAGGWGWTNYQIRASVWAGDMCKNSDITVNVAEPGGVVPQRGGYIWIDTWVRYYNTQRRTIGDWINVPVTAGWPTRTYSRRISMTNNTQAVQVLIRSNVWIKQDASNWVPMTSYAFTICNLQYTSARSPGRCYGS